MRIDDNPSLQCMLRILHGEKTAERAGGGRGKENPSQQG
jgi:hypothetical protein